VTGRGLAGALHGQLDHETCAARRLAFTADLPAVGLDDLLSDGQAEPGTVTLGREEGLEQVLARLVVHAPAAVLDSDFSVTAASGASKRRRRPD
jgi:hypothetical protein